MAADQWLDHQLLLEQFALTMKLQSPSQFGLVGRRATDGRLSPTSVWPPYSGGSLRQTMAPSPELWFSPDVSKWHS